jgi:hypothetical protein
MKKKRYLKELEELKSIIPIMNKKKRKSVEERNKNKRIGNDLTYQRKFTIIKDDLIENNPFFFIILFFSFFTLFSSFISFSFFSISNQFSSPSFSSFSFYSFSSLFVSPSTSKLLK